MLALHVFFFLIEMRLPFIAIENAFHFLFIKCSLTVFCLPVISADQSLQGGRKRYMESKRFSQASCSWDGAARAWGSPQKASWGFDALRALIGTNVRAAEASRGRPPGHPRLLLAHWRSVPFQPPEIILSRVCP